MECHTENLGRKWMKTLTPSHSPITIVLFLMFLSFSDKFIPDPGSLIFPFSPEDPYSKLESVRIQCNGKC